MGTDRMNKNLSGLPMYHLRRIGPPPNKDRVINVMDLYRVTYMIGRSEVKVDFYIDSSNHIQSASISRCHARVVRQNGNQHRLYDDSLNGVFVNNIKIAGSCVLREGDKVTFGHPCGARLPAGSRARQPDSHHQFMYETCTCDLAEVTDEKGDNSVSKEITGFKKPVSPAEASGSNSTRRPKKPTRKPTQCFTSDDVKQLKAAWEERQSSSASDISDDSASEAENEPRQNIARKSVVVADEQSTETNSHSEEDKSVEGENYKRNGTSIDKQLPSKQSPSKSKSYNTESPGVMPKDIEMFSESDEDSHANDNSHTAVTSDVNHETVKLCRLTETDISPENDLNEQTDICSEHFTSKSPEKNDISALEGTVNSIMKDLCDLRGKIENSVEQSGHEVSIVFKSPTKDACIQTSQSENVNGEVGIRYVTASPTKDMGIQTSQIFPPQAVSSHVVETIFDEKFQTCHELASGTSDFDDVETIERTDDTTSLTGITATSNGSELDDEESTEKSNDTIQEDFEPAQEGCNEELNKETEFNETPHIEDTCKSNESESTVEEYATSMVLPDLDISEAFSNFAENELKQCSAKGENNECVYIKSKHQQHLNDNSNEFIEEDQISEENQSKQPSLILSDSVVYEADEENDDPDLFFSNSIEYSGSESDRNLSESETEEVDMDTKESSNDSEESENCDGEEDDNNTGGDDTCKSEDFINSDDNSLRKCSESEHGVNADNDKVGAAHENSENQSEGSVNVECRSDAGDLFKNSLNKMEIVSIEDISLIDGKVTDQINNDQIIERKRKNSEEEILETELDNSRKRHCSDTANILTEDIDKAEVAGDNDSSSSDNENECVSSSQKGLKKLKKGVKRFFKFWSKKSYEMNSKNEVSDGGYIYLQDQAGEYKLLDFESPDNVVEVPKSKDVEGSDNEHIMHKESHCMNEILNTDIDHLKVTDIDHLKVSLSNENGVAESVKDKIVDNSINENLVESHHSLETSTVEEKVHCENSELKSTEAVTDVTDDISKAEAEKKTEDVNEDEVNGVEKDMESSDNDIVETSMCHTDSEIDANEIIKPRILASVFRTPSKHISNTCGEKCSPISSPVLKTLSSQDVISQSQSPIIAKQGNHINNTEPAVAKNSATKLFVNESKVEELSELSCEFSDDDDNGFCSPEIDFSHLGDDSDDNDEDDERVDDSEIDSDQSEVEENSEDENCKITEDDTDTVVGMDKRYKKLINCIEEDTEEENINSDFDIDKNENEERTIEDQNTEDGDPLENLMNHGTEEEEDNEVTRGGSSKKPNGMNEIDFDFCDSEAEVETIEVPTDKKTINIDTDSGDNESDDDNVEDMCSRKKSSKRKCDSDLEDRSPKKQKSPTVNENDESSPQKGENFESTPFKTPLSLLKTRNSRIAFPSENSPGHTSCTQLLDSPQTPDLDALSMTQVTNVTEQLEKKVGDSSKSKASRNKAKDFLEKLKAKRRIKEEAADEVLPSSPTPGTSQSTEIELYSRMGNKERSQALVVLDDVNKHVNSCRDVIMKIKAMFDSCGSLQGNPRVTAWRKELQTIEKRLEFPKTVIAVVGDTGSGKSSLMNAILDHRSVLPTSGIRACTAVVVEVVNNTNSSYFEADIEFLQRQEWMEELQVLLKDLTGLDGTVKNRPPDPTSDAFVSYCKVRAVYGRIDKFEVLARLTTVTHWLGRVKVIKSSKPGDFRRQVEKYIETQEPGAGGQYWPIVKHVRLRMPNCDVCSSGASLVDLPGVRDSNAARDKIAKEYLKNCTAVWVVSSIHRAIDDKTAKDLLGENFRRQLLMDGQYGSIAFICTKTDVLMPSEIIRPLELEEQTKEHEDKITEMEAEKSELELTISNATKETRTLKKTIASVKTEAKELRDNLTELSNLLDSTDLDNSQSEEKEAIEEYEKELKEKVDELNEAENRLDELHDQKLEATQKTLELEKVLNVHRKAIAAICARARNEYSKTQIKRDFKAGLKEMKRRAGMLNDDNDEEDDIYSDDDDDDVGSHAENLKVFCCSSTEYQKMKNLLTDDGPPQVFSTLEDTQIPALRQYVHEMTSVRRRQWVERLIRNVGRFVFDLQMYMAEGGDMKSRNRVFAKTAIDSELQKFDTSLAPVFEKLTSDIDGVFDGSIRQKVEEGATNAATEANDTCSRWGAPVNRDKTKDKKSGGLHWATYRATVRRQGVFTSHSYGPVDFNEDLAEPMYRSMTIVWDRAFSGMLWRILDKLKQEIIVKLKTFIVDLTPMLEGLGIQAAKTVRVTTLLLSSASNKLTEMVAHLKDIITNKQRDISRIITPIVQTSLLPEYMTGAAECGPGTYMRIKACMSNGIDTKRFTMFDEATQQLMKYLMELQNEIVQYVHQVCQTLIQDLRTAFEPLWEAPANTSVIRSAFRQSIGEVCTRMHDIYDEAGLSHSEERALMSTSNTSTGQEGSNFSTTSSYDSGTTNECYKLSLHVKTEKLSQGNDFETMETASIEQIMHIKQERNTDEIEGKPSTVDRSVLNFGCQTLQDLQCGKLEVSPIEVTVKTTPATSSGPNVIIMPSSHGNSTRYNKPGSIIVPAISGKNQGTKAIVAQPNVGHLSSQKGSSAQYGLMQTLPNGNNFIQPYQMSILSTGQKVLLPNVKGPVSSTFVPSASKSTSLPNSNLLLNVAGTSTGNKLPNSNLLLNLATQASVNSSKQTPTIQVKKSVGSFQHGTPVLNSSQRQSSIPTLNMVFGKENVSLTPSNRSNHGVPSGSQPCVSNSSQSKGKKKTRTINLSRSQKNSPARMPSPIPVIKTEPMDRGVYGRVKDLGTIDLTDD